ncbi:hypothetical protein CAY59_18345 [Vibrio campbellii]|uniref:hypothetical protein n=1 Tax=Vibrio campbellii TaxID=680 RepID=UPI000A2FFAE4|nr:hypothetical protein [Vibrio campbellii]ARR46245.1 hypothetical protein CAY59_18345 [Vibrio campbellii]
MENKDKVKVVMAIDKKELAKLKDTSREKSKTLEWISIAIASIAVIVSAWLGYKTIKLTQEHNKQSVMPLISAWRAENNESNSITWSVYNAGLGPVKIKMAKAFIRGEEYLGSLGSLDFRQELTLNDNMMVDVKWNSIIIPDDIIKDGDDAEMVTIKWKEGSVPSDYDADFNLVLAYCYCSVYDECLYEDTRSGGGYAPLFNCPVQ